MRGTLVHMAAETKTWLTPARLARGPEAANNELKRWAREKRRRELEREIRSVFRPVKIYGDAAAMHRDALTSRGAGVGSALMAKDAKSIGAVELLIGAAALGGGIVFGLWLGKKIKTRLAKRRAEAVTGFDDSYVLGTDVLGEVA